MLKPNLPGAGMVSDTLDFVKNLWGSMQVPGVTLPGMAAPTLSLEELDKKINDLKAVEAWMNLNLGMLRGSIQALEVQRGTIATLKSMGATLSNAVKGNQADAAAQEKSLLASIPYASAFLFPNANPVPTTPDEMEKTMRSMAQAEAAAVPPPAPVTRNLRDTETGTDAGSDSDGSADSNDSSEPSGAGKRSDTRARQNDFATNLAQTGGAWWGMLQEQFKQVVASALAADKPAPERKTARADSERAKAAPKTAAKRSSKPRTKPPGTKSQQADTASKRSRIKKEK